MGHQGDQENVRRFLVYPSPTVEAFQVTLEYLNDPRRWAKGVTIRLKSLQAGKRPAKWTYRNALADQTEVQVGSWIVKRGSSWGTAWPWAPELFLEKHREILVVDYQGSAAVEDKPAYEVTCRGM